MLTKEWIYNNSNKRIKTICKDSIPLYLPTAYLMDVSEYSSSPNTPLKYAYELFVFFDWLNYSKIKLTDLTYKDVKNFRNALTTDEGYLFKRNKPSLKTKYYIISSTIRFLEWCNQDNDNEEVFKKQRNTRRISRGMLYGISTKMISKIKENLLPSIKDTISETLTIVEANQIRQWIMQRWKNHKSLQHRNRAIFELLFDGAFRRSELLGINLSDLDLDNGLIKITYNEDDYLEAWERGKTEVAVKTGERMVSIGSQTVDWVNQYIMLYRPKESIKKGHGRLFCLHSPTKSIGEPFTNDALSYFFYELNKSISENGCGLVKHVHPHMLRSAWATLAYDEGIDQKVIQDQLGHKNPETTSHYEKISPTYRKKQLDNWRSKHPERYNND